MNKKLVTLYPQPAFAASVDSIKAGQFKSVENEKELLRRIRMLAILLDNQFRVPGTNFRFGWDSVIGLIPGFGDVATGVLAAYIVYLAHQLNVPRDILGKMIVNVVIDVSAGMVPVVGDVLDVAWKANLKNIRLLEQYLRNRDSITH